MCAGAPTVECSARISIVHIAVVEGNGNRLELHRQTLPVAGELQKTGLSITGMAHPSCWPARFYYSLADQTHCPPNRVLLHSGIRRHQDAARQRRYRLYEDAKRKVQWVHPRGKTILDTCGGLGYFAAWCLQGAAAEVLSYEKNSDVLWLRSLNPWSPQPGGALAD